MQLVTQLPLATLFFKHWSKNDTEDGIVVAKASFVRDGDRWAASNSPNLELEDRFSDDPRWSPLAQEQDIAPGKVGTDLILHAIARSPNATPLPDWPVSISIPNRLHYDFHVRGPCRWVKGQMGSWACSAPEMVLEVPLSYELAYGGTSEDHNGEQVSYQNNPSGKGFATREHMERASEFPAPQIGVLAEFMGANPLSEMGVHGCGPIAKPWLPRRGHAGTFDDNWKATRHPRMPKDYSLEFWNAAPGALQCNPPMLGNETIVIIGITHTGPVHIQLPRVTCAVHAGRSNVQAMTLDTITMDLRSADPSDYRLDLVWRTRISEPESFQYAEIVGHTLED